MSRFQKRQTVKTLEIGENRYEVDFGRDDIALIFQDVVDRLAKIEAAADENTDAAARQSAVLAAQKEIFKDAINRILEQPNAAGEIFRHDDTAIFHSDIYSFLVMEYKQTVMAEYPYTPDRLMQ